MIVIFLLSISTLLVMNFMIDYMDMKPIMMTVVIGMITLFNVAYIWYELKNGKKPSALKEANMHKRLQLLSSAAFSLGHGGADSQKVMGIICAALLVYGNLGRQGNLEEKVPKSIQITELMQIEHKNQNGNLEKFKPEVALLDSSVFYVKRKKKDMDFISQVLSNIFLQKTENKIIIDASNGKVVYNEKKKLSSIYKNKKVPSFESIEDELSKIEVYTFGDALCDAKTNDTIFNKEVLNANYKYAPIFASFVDKKTGKLLHGHKIKTKVQSETMPFWIAFGCYLMIGLGTLMGGWKIVKTMGTKITKVTPLEGVCAETAGALTLFTVSQFGIPVSTTHTITGSIIGVGATKRLSAVRWGVTINLLWAWILTIPVSGLLAAIFYYLIVWLR
jgi:PiT family inorganic phosphate transporter